MHLPQTDGYPYRLPQGSRRPLVLMLSVFRDGALHSQGTIGSVPTRLGRTSDNDVVLDDAAKRVSRIHAEIRVTDQGILLTDLESANGTWVNGERITALTIEPGVPFTIGPYRLMVEEVPDTMEPPAPFRDPSVAFEPEPENPPPADPALKTRTGDTTSHPLGMGAWRGWIRAHPVEVGLGGAALGVIAVVLALVTGSQSGSAADANAPPAVATFDADATLREAQTRRQNGDLEGARSLVNGILQRLPNHERARVLLKEIEAATPPPPPSPPPAPAPAPVAETMPEPPPGAGDAPPARPREARRVEPPKPTFPLLPRLPGETEPQRVQRSRVLHDRYHEALNAVGTGQLAHADRLVAAILADEPAYEPATELQARVRDQRRELATRLRAQGDTLKRQGDLARALGNFQEAFEASPLPGLEEEISETRRTMYKEAAEALEEADLRYATGRLATSFYQKACRYLDRSHPRRDQACQRAKE